MATKKSDHRSSRKRLSLYPLPMDDALRAAMETGPPPKMRQAKEKPKKGKRGQKRQPND